MKRETLYCSRTFSPYVSHKIQLKHTCQSHIIFRYHNSNATPPSSSQKHQRKYQWNAQHPISITPSTISCHVDTLPPHDAKSNAANPSRRHLDPLPVSGFFAVFGTVDVDNYGQGWSNPCINLKRWYFSSQDSKRTGLLQRGPHRNNGKAYLEDSQVYSFGFLFNFSLPESLLVYGITITAPSTCINSGINMDVSKNMGTPKSSTLIGFSIINHPVWGIPIFGNPHINVNTLIEACISISTFVSTPPSPLQMPWHCHWILPAVSLQLTLGVCLPSLPTDTWLLQIWVQLIIWPQGLKIPTWCFLHLEP